MFTIVGFDEIVWSVWCYHDEGNNVLLCDVVVVDDRWVTIVDLSGEEGESCYVLIKTLNQVNKSIKVHDYGCVAHRKVVAMWHISGLAIGEETSSAVRRPIFDIFCPPFVSALVHFLCRNL